MLHVKEFIVTPMSYSSDADTRLDRYKGLVPGITLVAIVTAAAYGLRQVPGMSSISPMISAIFIGMLFANFTTVPTLALPGVALFGKKALRLAVALLGLQLTIGQVMEVGVAGMAVLAVLVAGTYGLTLALARPLGVDAGLARLLAAGTAICGASAVAAANAVQKGSDEDVSYAVATVTLFGTLAMLLYPLLGSLMGLEANAYGFWIGSSVHEVAQVVAAGFQAGTEAGEHSVVVKLSRVLLLAPLLITMSVLLNRGSSAKGGSLSPAQILPVFVVGFMLCMLANSFNLVPGVIRDVLVQLTPILLTAALGALGLGTRFTALREKGVRPLVLAAAASAFIATASLVLMPWVG
ncbi:YeiH family protein [Devosia sp. A369]